MVTSTPLATTVYYQHIRFWHMWRFGSLQSHGLYQHLFIQIREVDGWRVQAQNYSELAQVVSWVCHACSYYEVLFKIQKILMQLLYHEGQLIIVLFHFLTGRDIDTPETSTMQAASTSMFAHGRFISTSFGLPLSGFIMSPGLLFLLVNYNFVTSLYSVPLSMPESNPWLALLLGLPHSFLFGLCWQ